MRRALKPVEEGEQVSPLAAKTSRASTTRMRKAVPILLGLALVVASGAQAAPARHAAKSTRQRMASGYVVPRSGLLGAVDIVAIARRGAASSEDQFSDDSGTLKYVGRTVTVFLDNDVLSKDYDKDSHTLTVEFPYSVFNRYAVHSDVHTSTYMGENAFGVKTVVLKLRGFTYGFQLPEDTSIKYSAVLTGAAAKEISATVRARLTATISKATEAEAEAVPNSVVYYDHDTSDPTRDDPRDKDIHAYYVAMRPVKVEWINSRTGAIISSENFAADTSTPASDGSPESLQTPSADEPPEKPQTSSASETETTPMQATGDSQSRSAGEAAKSQNFEAISAQLVKDIGVALHAIYADYTPHAAAPPKPPVPPGLERFASGEIEFSCTVRCSFGFGVARPRMEALFRSGSWVELQREVVTTQMNWDLAYYYLGVAARRLGYGDAARKYLERSIVLSQMPNGRCNYVFNNCSGHSLPEEARLELDALKSADQQVQPPPLAANQDIATADVSDCLISAAHSMDDGHVDPSVIALAVQGKCLSAVQAMRNAAERGWDDASRREMGDRLERGVQKIAIQTVLTLRSPHS